MTALVLAPFKLGDLIQATALLGSLKAAWPGRPLLLAAARPEVAEAARLTGLFEQVVHWPEERWLAGDASGLPAARTVINLSSARPALRTLAAIGGAPEIVGPRLSTSGRVALPPLQGLARALMAVNRRLSSINLVDLWRVLSPLGPAAEARLAFPIGGSAEGALLEDSLLEATRGRVALQLGCGHHLRRWPVERFVELAGLVAPVGVVLLGGPGERALAKRFLALGGGRGGPPPLDLCGRTSLPDLARVLARARVLVSADTSTAHLAAAVGAPVASIFGGPAQAFETGPYGERVVIVQGYGPCSPCREGDDCPHGRCLALPPAGPVAAAALALMGRGGPGTIPEAPPEGPSPWTWRSWAAARDGLGQILVPFGEIEPQDPVMAEARLGLIARAAGAKALDLADLAAPPWPPGPENPESRRTLAEAAESAFEAPGRRKRFLEAADRLLAP